MNEKDLDPESRMQMRVIKLETALGELSKLNERLNLLEQSLEHANARVKILEEARQVQRSLNTTFITKTPEKKSFWSFLK